MGGIPVTPVVMQTNLKHAPSPITAGAAKFRGRHTPVSLLPVLRLGIDILLECEPQHNIVHGQGLPRTFETPAVVDPLVMPQPSSTSRQVRNATFTLDASKMIINLRFGQGDHHYPVQITE